MQDHPLSMKQMSQDCTSQHPVLDPFLDKFKNGLFVGILRWSQLDDLWSVLRPRAGRGWYLYAVGETVPEAPADEDAVLRFIVEIDDLLHREHDEDYCGIVYVDDLKEPTFIKIYDPHHLGSSCGSSGNPPKPGWIMSLLPPVDLSDTAPLPNARRRWWRRLWGSN